MAVGVALKFTRENAIRILKVIALSAAIGVAVGYFSFYVTMPSVSVPTTKNPSLLLAGAILLLLGLIVGALSDSLETLAVEILLGIVVGALLGFILFISPTFSPEIDIPFAEEYIFFTLRSALPLLILGGATLFVGGFFGTYAGEHMAVRSAKSPFADDAVKASKR